VLDAALAGTSLSWYAVQPGVARFTRVASYDRVGFGWSGPARTPRRVDVLADELLRALVAAELPPPYVLVGHSYGGWIALLLAARHPESVAGLVLVDVPHPRTWSAPTEAQRRRAARGAALARRAALLAEIGVTRLLYRLAARGALVRGSAPGERGRIEALLADVPDELRGPIRSFWVKPSTLRALASLIEHAPESAALVEAELGCLESVPLVLLTEADPSAERLRDQEDILRRSGEGAHVVARASGHWIPLQEPQLVVEAVRDVVDRVRARGTP
jgi:pimeloyl-ACP methyl ester carboxylesterase